MLIAHCSLANAAGREHRVSPMQRGGNTGEGTRFPEILRCRSDWPDDSATPATSPLAGAPMGWGGA